MSGGGGGGGIRCTQGEAAAATQSVLSELLFRARSDGFDIYNTAAATIGTAIN